MKTFKEDLDEFFKMRVVTHSEKSKLLSLKFYVNKIRKENQDLEQEK